MMGDALTRADIAEGLRDIGLRAGDRVVVHSSLRAFGRVEGGADAVVDALLEVLGPAGSLMLPSFCYSSPPTLPHFDPARTPGRTGAIPEAVRRRREAVRSLSPTHSVVAIGPDAEELTRDHLAVRCLGVGSPIDRLAARDGRVLLLGVGHTANTTVHIGEEHAGVPKGPWPDEPRMARVLLPDGRVIDHEVDTSPSCSAGFGAVEAPLRERGAIADGRIGPCLAQLMQAGAVVACVVDLLRARPDALLCTWPRCRPCVEARRLRRR